MLDFLFRLKSFSLIFSLGFTILYLNIIQVLKNLCKTVKELRYLKHNFGENFHGVWEHQCIKITSTKITSFAEKFVFRMVVKIVL